jgi:tetratricopeptide (TPR) repeat protein
LATLGEKLREVARHRRADPAALSRLIRGDLDWIAMKCLEKDRRRRYETASGLAADIGRHLSNEPVTARPPSRLYRLEKTLRRNRTLFSAAAGVLLVLIVGVCVSLALLVRENTAMRRAIAAERAAKDERIRNQEAAAALGKSGSALLEHGDLAGAEKALRDALAASATNDVLYADLSDSLASVLHFLHDLAGAEQAARAAVQLRRSLTNDPPALAWSLNNLADIRYDRGDLSAAAEMFREALGIMRRYRARKPSTFVGSLYALADTLERQNKLSEAESLYRELLARADAIKPIGKSVVSPGAGFARCLTESGWEEFRQGQRPQALSRAGEAEPLLRDSLAAVPQQAEGYAWQLAELRSRLADTLVLAAMADPALQSSDVASRLAEAETRLLNSEQRLQEDPEVEPPFKRDTVRRLVRLYESWDRLLPNAGKADKAAYWKQQLAARDSASTRDQPAQRQPELTPK